MCILKEWLCIKSKDLNIAAGINNVKIIYINNKKTNKMLTYHVIFFIGTLEGTSVHIKDYPLR